MEVEEKRSSAVLKDSDSTAGELVMTQETRAPDTANTPQATWDSSANSLEFRNF